MSSNGVTHFMDGQMDFATLDQFERDYFLFTQMMKLQLFKHFRMWKAFKVQGRKGEGPGVQGARGSGPGVLGAERFRAAGGRREGLPV